MDAQKNNINEVSTFTVVTSLSKPDDFYFREAAYSTIFLNDRILTREGIDEYHSKKRVRK